MPSTLWRAQLLLSRLGLPLTLYMSYILVLLFGRLVACKTKRVNEISAMLKTHGLSCCRVIAYQQSS